ncbi:FAD binding domain-containing protein [Amycolatopsis taiwanensis]|uniref:Carbon monoxide dehydrogenase n=1 Tax=Amycolatopsis taiwanensis TaxID=342230 RepID=A0A9W6R8R2_9PSEU|nr:xanthine dehydrogenase family protein subunit M [Amycolatopsis taiwanensis]GLY70350.1 carbon monoxide dehydrogenase [Amycolatopsis taiwanensis]
MYPAEFRYLRPGGLDEVHAALEKYAGDVKLLAGGQSLLPLMKLRLAKPGVLVDLAGAGELRGQWRSADGVRLGAMTTYRELRHSPAALAWLPGVDETLDVIADPQVRARGTIGGALAHGDPTADLPAMLLALNAHVRLRGPGGERDVALDRFLTGLYTTDLAEDEVLTSVNVPAPPAGSGAAYDKHEQPASHLALCGVAAVLTVANGHVTQARVAMTGVSSAPRRLTTLEETLIGVPTSGSALEEATEAVTEGVRPLDDLHAPAAYRLQLLRVATRRALRVAATRAGQRWVA